MTKREVMRLAMEFADPPYVPWSFGFTVEAHEALARHYGQRDVWRVFDNHEVGFYSESRFEDLGGGRFRDRFGVVWDRSVDRDIGTVEGTVLPEPTLSGYEFPDPVDAQFHERMRTMVNADEADPHFRVFAIGFSLYERAWTLRGMENLMMDFCANPAFVDRLLDRIADHNIVQLMEAVRYDVDAVHFGDDWGDQRGLQMGPDHWRRFIKPRLARMYQVARDAGKYVTIHSCGKVDSVFDDLVEIGVNRFNPFQPEVMDVDGLMGKYFGRLSFHGGLSTQKVLPYGTKEDVRAAVRHLIELGRKGGYVFAPAHSVEGDVPLANMLAFVEEIQAQPGYVTVRSN